DKGTDRASNDSTYWTFRTLQTLVMQDYNAFAPDVQHAWKTFEQQTAKQQYKMEQSYLRLYASHPKEAQRLLQNFEDKTMQNAQTLARRLTNNIITTMTYRTDMKYHFSSTQP
ncbi:dipeptidase, partial [Salmonella enterica subsp. enterica serovar Typhimurium]